MIYYRQHVITYIEVPVPVGSVLQQEMIGRVKKMSTARESGRQQLFYSSSCFTCLLYVQVPVTVGQGTCDDFLQEKAVEATKQNEEIREKT
jgi:hypothetical protein